MNYCRIEINTLPAPVKEPEKKHIRQFIPPKITKYKTFDVSYDKVWEATVRSFSRLEYDGEIVDKSSGLIKAKRSYVLSRSFGGDIHRIDHWPKKHEVEGIYCCNKYFKQFASIPSGFFKTIDFGIEDLSIYVDKKNEQETKVTIKYNPKGFYYFSGEKTFISNGVMEKNILHSIKSMLNERK